MISFKFGFFATCAASIPILLTEGSPFTFGKTSLRTGDECASFSPSSAYRNLAFFAFLVAGLSFLVGFLAPFSIMIFHGSAAIYLSSLFCLPIFFHALKGALFASSRMIINRRFIFIKFTDWLFFPASTAFLSTAFHASCIAFCSCSTALSTLIHKAIGGSAISIKTRKWFFNFANRAYFHSLPNKKRLLQNGWMCYQTTGKRRRLLFYRLFGSKAIIPYIGGIV